MKISPTIFQFRLFSSAPLKFDHTIKSYLQSAKNSYQLKEYSKAAEFYDKIIKLFEDKKIKDITHPQRFLLAKSLTYKASIIRVGTQEDENLALAHLEKALDLCPGLKISKGIRDSILSDRCISPSDLKSLLR